MIKAFRRFLIIFLLFLASSAVLFLVCPEVYAAEKLSAGRKLWDNIMLWVNFGILVFFFIKYAKKPLMDFLRGVRSKIAKDLNTNEEKLDDVKSVMSVETEKLETIDAHIESIRQSIIEMGKKEKEKIVAQAKLTAERMIEEAKAYSGYQLTKAKKALSDEMVDIAVSIAKNKLKKGISEEDDERLISRFILELDKSKQ